MSRHGSGKRRRTSPDPDDTGATRPEAASGPVEDAYDAGSHGSGEYTAHDPGAGPHGSGEYQAYDANAGAHGSGEYQAYDANPGPHGSGEYTAYDPGASTHGSGEYAAYDANAGAHGSGEYQAYDPNPAAHGSGEYAAYGAETYPQASYPPAEYESGGYAAAPPSGESGGYAAVSPSGESGGYAAVSPSGESGGYAAVSSSSGPDPYSPDTNHGASAYDPALDPALSPALDPALSGGQTTEFAAVHDEPRADEPKTSEASEAPAGRRAVEAPDPDTGMRPPPPPHEGDIIKLVGVGSLIWFALFVAAWLMRDTLEDDGRGWWPWCALAGSGLGLFGLWYCRRLRSTDED
ncbi:hypothetical protein [Embleya sp. NPDC001921]